MNRGYKQNINDGFEITLNPDASKISVIGKPFLRGKDLRKTVGAIKKHRHAFIMFWKDVSMTTGTLRKLMDQVDRGITTKTEE